MEIIELEAFRQSDLIRDYVFPLCLAARGADGAWEFRRFLGTGFLIGGRGFGLTAAHVVRGQPEEGRMGAIFVDPSGGWTAFEVEEHAAHGTEDVALVRLGGGPWRSFFRLSNTFETASRNYQMWGYPDDVAREIEEGGSVLHRPDLVYAQGYVRRRVSHEVPMVTGAQLFEVSEVVGQGCSGGPLYVNRGGVWDVIGVYAGELITDRGTSRAFAVREEAFRDWSPPMLGRTVLEESRDVAPGLLPGH